MSARIYPKNRDHRRGLDVINRVRKICGADEVKTIPVTKNPVVDLLDCVKHEVRVVNHEFLISNEVKAEKVSKALKKPMSRCKDGVVIPLPNSVKVFSDKMTKYYNR